jgi:hypothetical protein
MTEIRSVSVRMDADVASYVAKMRLAGRETDKAFASSAANLRATNRELRLTELRLGSTTAATKAQSTAFARLDSRTGKLNSSVVDLNGNLRETDVHLDKAGARMIDLSGSVRTASRDLDRGGNSIDRYSGRLGLLLQAAAVFGPTLAPLGAATVPVLGALTAGLGAAAGAIGVTLLATNGMGDALDALNEFQLEPTTENAAAMRAEFERVGPAGEQLIRYLDSLTPVLSELQMTSRNGIFPGVEEGIDALLQRQPQLRSIVAGISSAVGDLASDTGSALASERYDAFFDYLDNEAGPIIKDFGGIAGGIFETIANLIVELDPVTQSFTEGLLDKTRDMARWSSELGSNQSFQSFLDYIEESGPKAIDFLGTFVTSLADITAAVAPVGDVVLPVLTSVLDIVGAVAASDIGSPIFAGVAALSVYNRTLAATLALQTRMSTAGTLGGAATMLGVRGLSTDAAKSTRSLSSLAGAAGRAALPLAGVGIAASGAADGLGLTNSVSLALLGTLGGPWGIALGAIGGLFLDLAGQLDDLNASAQASIDLATVQIDDGQFRKASGELDRLQDKIDELESKSSKLALAAGLVPVVGSYLRAGIEKVQDNPEAEGFKAEREALLLLIDARRELKSLNRVDPLEALGEYFGDLNGEVLEATSLMYDFADAVGRAMGLLDDRAALRNYEAALDAVGASLKENGRTLDATTEKGRANQETLDDIARTGLAVADSLKGDRRRTFLDGLRENLRDTALRFGDTKAEARAFLDDLGLIGKRKVRPEVELETAGFDQRERRVSNLIDRLDLDRADPEVNLLTWDFMAGNDKALAALRNLSRTTATPRVNLDAGDALAKIASVRTGLSSLNDRTVYLTTVTRTVSGGRPMGGQGPGSASTGSDGATVPKTGLPYADRHLYLLADGEEVITNRNGEADRYRAANGIPPARRLAEGGTAGTYATSYRATGDWAVDATVRAARDLGAAMKEAAAGAKAETKSRMQELEKRQRLLNNELDQAQQVRDRIQSRYDDISSTVASRFDVDPFAVDSNLSAYSPGGGSVTNPADAVRGSIREIRQFNAVVEQLEGLGLTGAALEQATATASIDQLRDLLAGSRSEIRDYVQLLDRQQKLQQRAGDSVADTLVGKRLDSAVDELKGVRKDLGKVEDAIKHLENDQKDHPERAANAQGQTATSARLGRSQF